MSRLKTATNPESGATSYTYDPNGNVQTKTDARNTTTTFTYDAIDRLTGKTYNDSTPGVSYEYDIDRTGSGSSPCAAGENSNYCLGRLTRMSSSVSTTTYYKYDALGRISQSTQRTNAVDYPFMYQYNLAGDAARLLLQTLAGPIRATRAPRPVQARPAR